MKKFGNGLKIDFGSYEEDIKNDMLLLWNIEKFTFQCRKFMVPCIDEKYYEHELDLKNYDLDSGYMLGINEDVLKVRHEKDKIIMTSLKESFRDWEVYRFIEKTDTSSHGYTCEMLSNSRKSSFFQGVDDSGKSYTVRVHKAKCYQQALSELYQVFVYNKICWTTVNTGYLDRFYEIDTDGETDGNGLKIDFGSYEEDIKNDMLLLWNMSQELLQRTMVITDDIRQGLK